MTGISFAALLSTTLAVADDIVVIDDNLDVLPAGYSLATRTSANATASLVLGEVGNSTGLVFIGSWNVPANGQEYAVGALVPTAMAAADFQFDPASSGAVASLQWSLDLAVNSTTMTPSVQGIFAQLVVYQLQADDTVLAYTDGGTYIAAGEASTVDVIADEASFGLPGDNPDFSASGGPIAFGLQFGALYPGNPIPEPLFLTGTMEADNWTVTVSTDTVGDLFGDGFETGSNEPTAGKASLSAPEDCDCSIPGAVSWPVRD